MKSEKLLSMFTVYCKEHPEQRFWQALCNWSGYTILASFYVPGGSQQWNTFNMEDDFQKWPRPSLSKDCGCHTCRPITLADMRMILCPTCGNKRCPRANFHGNDCSGSNEPGQKGSAYA